MVSVSAVVPPENDAAAGDIGQRAYAAERAIPARLPMKAKASRGCSGPGNRCPALPTCRMSLRRGKSSRQPPERGP